MKPLSRGPWTAAASALLLSILLAPSSHAAALPLSFGGIWTLALDNHYYRVDPGLLSVDLGQFALAATTSLVNCRRSSGAAQVATANSLVWSGGLRIVYLQGSATAFDVATDVSGPVLSLTSATGDIVCDGAVGGAGTLFTGDFE